MSMNPAERYAALKLLEAGLKAALIDAAAEADAYRQQVRARSLDTDWGTVTVAKRKPSLVVTSEQGLIDWCVENLQNIVIYTIPPESRSWLLTQRFAVAGDEAVDPVTGEVLPFLAVKPGTEYLTCRLTAEAKDAAKTAVAGRLADSLAAAVAPALTEGTVQ